MSAGQEVGGSEGIEVAVATESIAGPARGRLGRFVDFLRDVRNEIRKVTWPTWDELKKATLVIVVFVAVLGLHVARLGEAQDFPPAAFVVPRFRWLSPTRKPRTCPLR